MPEATFSFTVPSLHDDTVLDCRIYTPSVAHITEEELQENGVIGAIIAHPYAPLGGCYDDHVVLIVVEELVRQGCFVGTFNFRSAYLYKNSVRRGLNYLRNRGVYGGNGHTSWTGKPEIQDYISFAGFFAYYVDLIRQDTPPKPPTPSSSMLHPESNSQAPSASSQDIKQNVKLILGGYSYGSIIVTRLPPFREILSRFKNPKASSAAAEILQRARTISDWTKQKIEASRQANVRRQTPSRRHSPSITIGGEEMPSEQRHSSREGGLRNVDPEGLRKSLDVTKRLKGQKSHSHDGGQITPSTEISADDINLPLVELHYLLVSPVLGILGSALSAFGAHSEDENVKTTLAKGPTLVVYGDHDMFTTLRKIRSWTHELQSRPGRFHAVEVLDAGHFWREPGVAEKLRDAIGIWIQELQAGQS